MVGAALASSVAATLASGPALGQRRRSASERAPVAASPEEQRILGVIDDIYRNEHYLNVPPADGRLLRILAESIGAKQVVELGTSTGASGLWLLLALRKTAGRLTTYDIDPGRNRIARQNFDRAGVANRVTAVLGDALAEIA